MPQPRRPDKGTSADRWRAIQHLLAIRAGHACEGCGKPFEPGRREPSIHHRQPRGMGGTSNPAVHDLTNLLLMCAGTSRRLAGVLGCHGQLESHRAAAEHRGLIVRHPTDPATVPVTLHSGRRVSLDPTGVFYLPPSDGIPYDTT